MCGSFRIFDFLDTYIQKAKKTYQDSRSRRNLNTLNTELHDVQRIMVQNIDDVLQRGAVLSGKTKLQTSNFWCQKYWFCFTELDTKAQNLKHHSSKYKKDASLLNATSWMAIGAGGTILFLVFFIWYKFLLWNCFFENNFVIGKKNLKYFPNKTYPAFQVFKVILNSIFKKKYSRLLGDYSPREVSVLL